MCIGISIFVVLLNFRMSALAQIPPRSPALPLRALQLLTSKSTWILRAKIKYQARVKRESVSRPSILSSRTIYKEQP